MSILSFYNCVCVERMGTYKEYMLDIQLVNLLAGFLINKLK